MESGSSGRSHAWSLDTLEEPPIEVVDAGQKTPTPNANFNDREKRDSVIAHKERAEIRELKKELDRVTRERDILGKATAYFSARDPRNG